MAVTYWSFRRYSRSIIQYITGRGCHTWAGQIAPAMTAYPFLTNKGLTRFTPRTSPLLCSSLWSWSSHLQTVIWKALSRAGESERMSNCERKFAQNLWLLIRQTWSVLITLVTYHGDMLGGFSCEVSSYFFPSALGYLTVFKDSNTACTHPWHLLNQKLPCLSECIIPLPSVLHWCLSFPNLLLSTACATASFSCCSDT